MTTTYTPVEYSATTRQVTLRDLLVILFRRRWIVLGISLPIIIFGIYGTLTTSDSYTASSQVLIEARSVETPAFRILNLDMDAFMNTAVQVAQSIPVAQKAAELLVDSIPALKKEYPLLTGLDTVDDVRDLILLKISCGQVAESRILSINFSHTNPRLAILAVGAVTDAFIAYNIESRQNSSATEYYAEKITEVHSEIDSLINLRVLIFEQAGLSGFRENNESGIHQMRALEYEYFKTRAQREGLEKAYNGVLEAVRLNQDYMPTVHSAENSTLVGARSALDEAILNLAELRISYQDSSRFVQRQRELVDESRKLFVQERQSFLYDLKISLESVTQEEQSKFRDFNSYKAQILSYPVWESKIRAVEMRVNTKHDLLESLQMKFGEVRLKAESDQRISNITQLNAPSVSAAVGGGKKIIYLLLSSILGVVLGVVVALLVDAQGHRIFDPRQAENVLEIPVLGTISSRELPWSKP